MPLYTGKVYPREQILELLSLYRSNTLKLEFLRDRAEISEVHLVYSLNEWEGSDYPRQQMQYSDVDGVFRTQLYFGEAPSVCFRYFVKETADYSRWEDRNRKNWFLNTKNQIEFYTEQDIAKKAALLISSGKIGGWFQGGSEFGARALGHRSIIADPRNQNIRDDLNFRVKHREWFRPYAPACLLENASDYFESAVSSPAMMFVTRVKEDKKNLVPGIVHVDGTARIQTVTHEENGIFYLLVRHFRDLTGIPMILNTSFNLAGEPIVESPADALFCFLNSELDFLVMEDILVTKEKK